MDTKICRCSIYKNTLEKMAKNNADRCPSQPGIKDTQRALVISIRFLSLFSFFFFFWPYLSLTKIREVVVLLYPLCKETISNYSKSLLSPEGELPSPKSPACSLLPMHTEYQLGAKHSERCQEYRHPWDLAPTLEGDPAQSNTCRSSNAFPECHLGLPRH